MRPHWIPREPPLVPAALWAAGETLHLLENRLHGLSDRRLQRLSCVRTREGMLLLGDDLPWLEGVVWLGRDPEAANVWMPVHLATDIPAGVLELACLARCGGPVALIPEARDGAGASLMIPLRLPLPLAHRHETEGEEE